MFLVSSNAKKLAEIKRYGLNLELRPGLDLPEIEGTPDEVITHKAIAAGVGAVVEDTILTIQGVPVIDIRWRLEELSDLTGVPAQWIVSLGHNDGESVHLYRGTVDGLLACPNALRVREGSFGFDPYFIPEGQTQSLDDFEVMGQKDRFSARRLAVDQLLNHMPVASFSLRDIPAWTGAYQGAARLRL